MTCADSSSLIAYWQGEEGRDVLLVDSALASQTLLLAPVCLCELLCSPFLTSEIEQSLLQLPQLEIRPGYWERAGRLRSSLLRHGYKPKLADSLIAQSCLDHRIPLISRDRDFQAFRKHAGLELL